ncbi:MAG: TIM barrel protein [Candidatus Latescibacteria bacterium]|jgi:sugar phosphate isomerase/epimerase|nr:TIM barrel protein [Candidatus Latescibacterota bacterium]
MKLSLSGRILQGAPEMSTPDFIRLARDTGFDMVELRANQVPLESTEADLSELRRVLDDSGVGVSMIVVGGADQAREWIDVARAVGATNLRANGSVEALSAAADSLPEDLRLVFQMHSGSEFENVAQAADSLARIPSDRFGVMPEPANLLFSGERWSDDLFVPLKGRIYGCNAQSIALDPESDTSVPMNDGRKVPYSRRAWSDNAELGFPEFISALRAVGYDDYINFIDPSLPGTSVQDLAAGTAEYARQYVVG